MSPTHLPHVSLGREDDGFQAVVRVLHVLLLHYFHEPGKDLGVHELRVSENCTARLDGLWGKIMERMRLLRTPPSIPPAR